MASYRLECIDCGHRQADTAYDVECPACGRGCLEVVLENDARERTIDSAQASIFRFHRLMPFDAADGAGAPESFPATPEFPDAALSEHAGARILVKDETLMPTGTWKDREGFLSIHRMMRRGVRDAVLFSSGNTGISLARSASILRGPRLHLVVPRASEQRVRKAFAPYDTGFVRIIVHDGSNDECIMEGKRLAAERGYALEGGFLNVARREGLKLLALEHIFLSGEPIDWYAQPVAGGIGVYAFEKAYRDCGLPSPRILGVQAEICAPMVAAWRAGAETLAPEHVPPRVVPSDFVRVLRTRDPGHAYSVVKRVLDRCRGAFEAVSDAEILAALRAFYRSDYFRRRYAASGALVGLEAATALAGVAKAVRAGVVAATATVLLNVSGAAKAGDVQPAWIPEIA